MNMRFAFNYTQTGFFYYRYARGFLLNFLWLFMVNCTVNRFAAVLALRSDVIYEATGV